MTDNKGRIIFFAIIYTITAICVLFGCYAVYNIAFVEKPWTLGVTYIDKLEYSEDQQSVATVSVKHNVNNNGASLYEILFNGYTDTEGNYVEGFGIQCLGDFTVYNTYYGTCFSSDGQTITEQDVFNNSSNYSRIGQSTVYLGDFSYYHTGDNGLTYSKLPTNEIPTEIIIDINGDFYKLNLKSEEYYVDYNWRDYVFNWNSWGHSGYTVSGSMSWLDVFARIIDATIVNSGTNEYAEFSLPLLDLANYLEITYSEDGKQFNELPDTSATRTYLTIPVAYSSDGATEITDSMFKMVNNSTSWSYWNDTSVKDYWGVDSPINITAKQVNYIYYESYGGYFITLDKKLSNYLKVAGANEININIDCNNLTYDVLGVDLQNFDFKISTFNITNSTNGFVVLNQDSWSTVPTITEV